MKFATATLLALGLASAQEEEVDMADLFGDGDLMEFQEEEVDMGDLFGDGDLMELAVAEGQAITYSITKTQEVPAPEAGKGEWTGETLMAFGPDGKLTTNAIWGGDKENTIFGEGEWTLTPAEGFTGDVTKYKNFADKETNVHWATADALFSGKFDGDNLTGVWNSLDGETTGKWTGAVECDWKCMTEKGIKDAGAGIKKGSAWLGDKVTKAGDFFNEKLSGSNGTAWALGSIGVVLVACCGVYFCCCKKDKGVMNEGSEGGSYEQVKDSLL